MKFNKLFLVAVVVLIFIVGGSLLFMRNKQQQQTASSYEDAGGWVYKCSQPVTVKDQGVTYGSGKPSLTPVNQSEANKYCHKIGIE